MKTVWTLTYFSSACHNGEIRHVVGIYSTRPTVEELVASKTINRGDKVLDDYPDDNFAVTAYVLQEVELKN